MKEFYVVERNFGVDEKRGELHCSCYLSDYWDMEMVLLLSMSTLQY